MRLLYPSLTTYCDCTYWFNPYYDNKPFVKSWASYRLMTSNMYYQIFEIV
jgi:hypothetical protein